MTDTTKTTPETISRDQLEDLWTDGDAIMRMHVRNAIDGNRGALRLCADEWNARFARKPM